MHDSDTETAWYRCFYFSKLVSGIYVTIDYLIGVSESKLPYTKSNLSDQEQQMLFLFKRLSKAQKEKAVSYIEGMLEE